MHRRPTVAFGLGRCGQVGDVGRDAGGEVRVVEADLGVLDGCGDGGAAPVAAAGVARDEEADHRLDVVVRAAQPVLHGQEPGAQVLRLAGEEAQDARQAAQHRHLRLAAGCRRGACAAQALHEGHRASRGPGHVEGAEASERHHLARGHAADDGVAGVAAGLQVGEDGADVLLEEEQVGDDEVAVPPPRRGSPRGWRGFRPIPPRRGPRPSGRGSPPPAGPVRGPRVPPCGCRG